MKLTVKNLRRIERAEIEIPAAGVCLVAGPNEAGKTSLCQSLAAALTGNPLLVPGVTKGRAGVLLHDGSEDGGVTVEGDDWLVEVSYPGCDVQGKGTPPQMSAFAAGLSSIVDMKTTQERAAALAPYLKAVPTREDLTRRLTEAGISAGTVNKVWESVETQGWDAAWDRAKENATKLKGEWERVTGQKCYGSKIAADWKPAGWSDDLDEGTAEDLETEVAQAKVAVEQATRADAVSDAEIARLKGLADALDARAEALQAAREAIEPAEAAMEEARTARAALPAADDTKPGTLCPCCGKALLVTAVHTGGYTLSEAPKAKITAEERKARQKAIAGADGKLARARDALNTAKGALLKAGQEVEASEAAVAKLSALDDQPKGSADEVAAARAALATAEARFKARQAKDHAGRLHMTISGTQAIIDALAPDGLRKTVLENAIEAFNGARLAPLCTAAKIRPVAIRADLAVTMGGRSFGLLSASAQWRVRAVLACAFAQLDGSPLVILDGADIVEPGKRGEVVRLVNAAGLPALVTMTYSVPDLVPDMAGAKPAGGTWWMQDGVAAPLADVKRKEAA